MSERMPWQGKITHEATVTCAYCEQTSHYDSGRSPARQFRREGWVFTKPDGWVCPNCQKKESQ